MIRRGLAPATITKRTSDLRSWLAVVGPRWPRARARDVERWLDRRSLGVRARYVAISNLSAFYRWAMRQGLAAGDPTTLVERPRLPRTIPRPAQRAAIERAIAGAPPQLAAALVLMADCGLRCCEVAGLTWRDVDHDQGVIYVRGKGSHERMVGLPARAAMVLGMLRLTASDDAGNATVIAPATTAAGISHRVNRYLHGLGISDTAHQLRHLYATRLLASTGDLTIVQRSLGHASIATTQGYAAVDVTAAVRAARQLD